MLHPLQKYPMFHTISGSSEVENYEEFDDAREVVDSLSKEYEACERSDYIERGQMPQPATSASADPRVPVH